MNATQNKQKQIGDQVRITAGQHKNAVGRITGKERRGWTITLEDGAQVTVPFPMVVLVEEAGEAAADSAETPTTAVPTDRDAGDSAGEHEADAPTQPKRNRRKAARTEADGSVETDRTEAGGSGETGGASPEIAKMTVRELWALAKQRGVSVARTKADFYRIIKEKNPDEDLAILKGKALFDRVSELHISRLRSKQEMARLLSAS